ncbi:putative endonuclease or glycosyl hydrolase isoform X2 [Wolffia australiana]
MISSSIPDSCGSTERPPSAWAGPVGIFWDMENCPIPNDVSPDEVAGNIRLALRLHPLIGGAVNSFAAYGDFNGFPRRLREACQRTGVKLVDVPNTRKDAADKAILMDLFLFALDHPPPSTVLLISGDVDFAPALHVLGQRGYAVILIAPAAAAVSAALRNAGHFLWDWPAVARGGAAPAEDEDVCRVEEFRPGDLSALKRRITAVLIAAGGSLPLLRLPAEYVRMYGRPLYLAEYGATKLVQLLCRMPDAVDVVGEGKRKVVVLRRGQRGGSWSSSSGEEYGGMERVRREVEELLVCYGGRILGSNFEEMYQRRYKRELDYQRLGVARLEELLEKVGDVVVLEEERATRKMFLVSSSLSV